MSIFNLHSNVLADYRDFVRSFFSVADDRAREFIDRELVEQARLWPEALLQVSPSYARVASVDELATRGILLSQTAQIFRNDRGEPFVLYQYQVEAMERASREESYVVTSGTGSGKSLTYFLPIIDAFLRRPPVPDVVAALVVYCRERIAALNRGVAEIGETIRGSDTDDRGGADTFFAWFLRGRTPLRILSGSLIRKRYAMPQSPFFEDNYAALVLGCAPGEVTARFASVVGRDTSTACEELRRRSCRFLRASTKLARGDRFEAVQAAAIEWIKETDGPHRALANVVWHQRFEYGKPASHATEAPEIGDWLGCRTFFTELRNRPELRDRLWPEPKSAAPMQVFRERELRARLLAAAARLGHAFIDLYVPTIRRLGSLQLRVEESTEEASEAGGILAINDFLARLESQMRQPLAERDWGAFDELAEIGANFDLIVDVNVPDARFLPLVEVARRFGTLLSTHCYK